MKAKRIFSFISILLIVLTLAGTAPGPAAAQQQGRSPQPPFVHFKTVLRSGQWKKHVLGPSSAEGGYVVDISPRAPSTEGAHIEHKVLPEFTGKKWVDVLWMILTEEAHPLPVDVRVYSTRGWPVVWREELDLAPGEWQGYCVRDSVERGSYVIEINPHGQPAIGASVEKALIQPEFPWGAWVDVLRIQIPADQEPLQAEVVIYRQPDLPVASEFHVIVEPEGWQGYIIGRSSEMKAYLVEIDPVIDEGNWLEHYTIQQEFDGSNWNDVLRLSVAPGYPPMELIARVYAAQP